MPFGEGEGHPCELSANCVYDTEAGSSTCAEGYEWENPADLDNYNCTLIPESVCELEIPEAYMQDTYSTGCPPNSSPSGQGCYCDDGYTLNASSDGCVQMCTADDECLDEETACIGGTCIIPPCSPDSCAEGLVCGNDGNCRADPSILPPAPMMDCPVLSSEECLEDNTCCIPAWDCIGMDCATLMPFDPEFGHGYWNYPLNSETRTDQYQVSAKRRLELDQIRIGFSSYVSNNLGTATTGLGDMSEAMAISLALVKVSQATRSTHVNGHDMDIAYYQLTGDDNHLRAVCEHYQNGQDATIVLPTPSITTCGVLRSSWRRCTTTQG